MVLIINKECVKDIKSKVDLFTSCVKALTSVYVFCKTVSYFSNKDDKKGE